MNLKTLAQIPKSSNIFEALIITSILFLLSMLFFKNDPLFLYSNFPIFTIITAILVLFYGTLAAAFIIPISGIYFYFFYPLNLLESILGEYVLILIFIKFHTMWSQKVLQTTKKFEYLDNKLKELTHSFYLLKTSHDILEKSYISKPYSIRDAFKSIKKAFYQKEHFSQFLNILKSFYGVNEAILVINKNKNLTLVATTDQNFKFDQEDILIKEAIDQQKPIYIHTNNNTDKNSKFLAVIPVLQNDTLIALLAIRKISFLNFNKDNLQSITIALRYFFDQLKFYNYLKINPYQKTKEALFNYELNIVAKLKKEYNINSHIVIFKLFDELLEYTFLHNIEKIIRSIDQFIIYQNQNTNIIILLPLSSNYAAESFAKRVQKEFNSSLLNYKIFNILDTKLMKKYIEYENARV